MDSQKVDMLFKLLDQLLVLVVIPLAGFLVQRYVKSARTKDAFSLMSQHVASAVQRLNKTRRELRDPAKPGQWTDDEARRLREAALREVRVLLGDSMDVLVSHLGSETKVDQAILHSIDAAAESTRTSAVPAEPVRPSAPAPEPVAQPAGESVASNPSAPPARAPSALDAPDAPSDVLDADRTSKEPAAQP